MSDGVWFEPCSRDCDCPHVLVPCYALRLRPASFPTELAELRSSYQDLRMCALALPDKVKQTSRRLEVVAPELPSGWAVHSQQGAAGMASFSHQLVTLTQHVSQPLLIYVDIIASRFRKKCCACRDQSLQNAVASAAELPRYRNSSNAPAPDA